MTLNLYVMPLVGDGSKADPRRPKYRDSVFPTLDWGMFDYGDQPSCLVGILDIPPATDTALTANADVIAVPQDLEQQMGSVQIRNAVRNGLESRELPGTWVQTTNTYRDVIKVTGACCQFAQRYQGLVGGVWFSGTVHVSSTFSTLSQTQQNGIIAAANSFGFSTAAIVGSATIRDVLKNLADQYLARNLALIIVAQSLYTA